MNRFHIQGVWIVVQFKCDSYHRWQIFCDPPKISLRHILWESLFWMMTVLGSLTIEKLAGLFWNVFVSSRDTKLVKRLYSPHERRGKRQTLVSWQIEGKNKTKKITRIGHVVPANREPTMSAGLFSPVVKLREDRFRFLPWGKAIFVARALRLTLLTPLAVFNLF